MRIFLKKLDLFLNSNFFFFYDLILLIEKIVNEYNP